MAPPKLYLYDTEDCSRFAQVSTDGSDVVFPPNVLAWTEVLDCRVEPYTEHSLAENCELAHHVRKKYILVRDEQVSKENPTG